MRGIYQIPLEEKKKNDVAKIEVDGPLGAPGKVPPRALLLLHWPCGGVRRYEAQVGGVSRQ